MPVVEWTEKIFGVDDLKKIVFLDIDGTLVEYRIGKDKVSDATIRAIEEIRQKGGKVVLCSGRALSIMDDHIRNLPVDGYVTSNGAYAEIDGEIVHNVSLTGERLAEVLDFLDDNKIMYVAETQRYAYYSHMGNKELMEYVEMANMPQKYAKDAMVRDYQGINMFIMFIDTREQEQKAKEFLREFTFIRQTGYRAYDVLFTSSSKAEGALAVRRHFGEDNETYAFGDGMNDRTLFSVVDVSIAMGNACDILKEEADHITEDVDKEGVLKALVSLGLVSPELG